MRREIVISLLLAVGAVLAVPTVGPAQCRGLWALCWRCVLRGSIFPVIAVIGILMLIPIGAGASADLRQPLGIAVVGRLLLSQALTLFITPVIYLYMERLSQWLLRAVSRYSARPPL